MKTNRVTVGLGLAFLGLVLGWAGLTLGQSPYGGPVMQPMQPPAPTQPSQPQLMPMQQPMPPMPVQPGQVEVMPMQPDALRLPDAAAPAPVQVQAPAAPAMPVAPAAPVVHSVQQEVADTGMSADNPTGRQEPAVSIEWIGPSAAKVGQPIAYQIVVKNISPTSVQDVMVKCPFPKGIKISATEPKANTDGDMMTWKLGTMEPRQEIRLDLQMTAEATGTIFSNATVTFSAASSARLQVYQPKLALKAAGPSKVIVGDPATVTLMVTNPGDAVAERVKVVVLLSDGLEHARGKNIEYDLGNLGPKETRSVQVLCSAKESGNQTCEATAIADPGLSSQDTAQIEVLQPRIDLSVSAPGLRYLDRHAVLNIKVTNPGTATANGVNVVEQIPQGFKFVAATHEGRHDFVSRTVYWTLGDIPPGQTQEVTLDLVAINPGEHKNKAVATAARGLKAESEVTTRVEGLPALLMEVADLDDPVEIGAETSYEIRVTNTGTKTETNLQLTCEVPEKMEFLGAKGPGNVPFKAEGKEVIFEPLPKLAPRADAIYRVRVKGLAAGDLRFRARIKADGLSEPVLKEESTKVYGDDPTK